MHLKSSIDFCSVRLVCLSTNRYYDSTYSSLSNEITSLNIHIFVKCQQSATNWRSNAKTTTKSFFLSGLGDTIWHFSLFLEFKHHFFKQQGNGLLETDISNRCYWGSVGETVWPFTYSFAPKTIWNDISLWTAVFFGKAQGWRPWNQHFRWSFAQTEFPVRIRIDFSPFFIVVFFW